MGPPYITRVDDGSRLPDNHHNCSVRHAFAISENRQLGFFRLGLGQSSAQSLKGLDACHLLTGYHSKTIELLTLDRSLFEQAVNVFDMIVQFACRLQGY